MKVRGEIYVVSRGGDENSYIILIWACLKISPRSCSKESSTICAATNLSFCRSVVIHTTWGEKLCIHPYNWNWEEHCKSIPYWPLWYQNLRKILQMHKPTPEVKNKYERESSITKLHMIHTHTHISTFTSLPTPSYEGKEGIWARAHWQFEKWSY